MEIFVLISEHTSKLYVKRTFGDGDDGIITMSRETKFPDLLHKLGIFKSKSDARRNGWDKEIPLGYHHIVVGKLRHSIEVLKTTDMDDKINHLMSHKPVDIFHRILCLQRDINDIINLLENDKFEEVKQAILECKVTSLKESEEFWNDYIGFEMGD